MWSKQSFPLSSLASLIGYLAVVLAPLLSIYLLVKFWKWFSREGFSRIIPLENLQFGAHGYSFLYWFFSIWSFSFNILLLFYTRLKAINSIKSYSYVLVYREIACLLLCVWVGLDSQGYKQLGIVAGMAQISSDITQYCSCPRHESEEKTWSGSLKFNLSIFFLLRYYFYPFPLFVRRLYVVLKFFDLLLFSLVNLIV